MNLRQYISSGQIVLLDGAMGTQLDKRGLMARGSANLENPEAVREIHQEYLRSGANVLITNTLTMNRIYLETHQVEVDVHAVNRAGAELARQAVEVETASAESGLAGKKIYVLGDISSTGQMLEPYGTYKVTEFYETFKEQAGVLAAAGVDGFIIETMFDLNEAVCAVRACKENYDLPVVATMAFGTDEKGGRTVMGQTAEECVKGLREAGAEVVGANCGDVDPAQVSTIISLMREAGAAVLLAQPNAGIPKLVSDKTVFDMGPEAFAEGVQKCIVAGAKWVGGCCGTSPEHIAAVAQVLDRQ